MLNSELIESNTQFIKTWNYFASQCPSGENLESGGLAIAWSNTANILINAIFVSNPIQDEADLEAQIKLACDYADKHSKPWCLMICEDWLPEAIRPQAPEILSRYELVPLIKLAGMAADKLLPPVRPLPTLDCVCVDNPQTRRAVADINAISHNIPCEQFRELFEINEFWGETVFASVGYVEDKAVSTAMTLLIDGRFYVAFVATLPEYRKQGYGETVIRHSLAQAEQYCGICRTVLHATPDGAPVYQRMGYHRVTDFQTYTRKGNI
jgi:ribosomal protein S18 acetylase RimI-like enzyme